METNIAYLQTESCAEQLFQAETRALNALDFTGNLKRLAVEYGELSERYLYIRSLFIDFLPNVMPDLPKSQRHFDTLPKLSADINLKHVSRKYAEKFNNTTRNYGILFWKLSKASQLGETCR